MVRGQRPYGPVLVVGGAHSGRIGEYDDDEHEHGVHYAIVYFGDPLVASKCHLIPSKFLAEVTSQALMGRDQILRTAVTPFNPQALRGARRTEALEELNYVEAILADRWMTAQSRSNQVSSLVFISYSSKDRKLARWLSVDISGAGHAVWLDEWRIKVGESIPNKIGQGLCEAEFVVLLLSKHAVESRWVEQEWQAKYWQEIQDKRIMVLPVLLEDCQIPILLRAKRYADLRESYGKGIEDLLVAINSLSDVAGAAAHAASSRPHPQGGGRPDKRRRYKGEATLPNATDSAKHLDTHAEDIP